MKGSTVSAVCVKLGSLTLVDKFLGELEGVAPGMQPLIVARWARRAQEIEDEKARAKRISEGLSGATVPTDFDGLLNWILDQTASIKKKAEPT